MHVSSSFFIMSVFVIVLQLNNINNDHFFCSASKVPLFSGAVQILYKPGGSNLESSCCTGSLRGASRVTGSTWVSVVSMSNQETLGKWKSGHMCCLHISILQSGTR